MHIFLWTRCLSGLPRDSAEGKPCLWHRAAGRPPAQWDHLLCCHPQLSLLVPHQSGDNVNPCSEDTWPLGGDIPFAGSLFLIPSQQSVLPHWRCPWSARVGQLKQLSRCLAVQALGELINGRRHFWALTENSSLPLQPFPVPGPFGKAGEIPLGMDVLSNAKILAFSQTGFTTFLAFYHLLLLHDSRG